MMDTNDCKTLFMMTNLLKMRITKTQVINNCFLNVDNQLS